jgi:hypothetical protein
MAISTCHARTLMLKKSIAAALLVVMMAWAELALAPMLFMHGGPVHAAAEMAKHVADHEHAMPAGHHHPCCPAIGKTESVNPIEFAASSSPCDDEHRCCFRQGPQSVPGPVSSRVPRELAQVEPVAVGPAHTVDSRLPPTLLDALGPPPDQFGMVLRV